MTRPRRRLAWRCRVVLPLAIALAGIVPAAAHAEGRLDPAFGEGGVVQLAGDISDERVISGFAAAADGRVYFAEAGRLCSRGGCPEAVYLKAYDRDGDLIKRFGSRRWVARTKGETSLAVDRLGRPLLAWGNGKGGVLVRRFSRGGVLDRSFGDFGTTFVSCRCEFESLQVAPGGKLLVAGGKLLEGKKTYVGSVWVFARLHRDGGLDRGFGRAGVARLRMPGYNPLYSSVGVRGGTILAGFRCCGRPWRPFASRLTPDGTLDRSFTGRATRALRRLPGPHTDRIDLEGMTVLPRRGGGSLVVGHSYGGGGVAAALRRDGRRDRSYGRNGVRTLKIRFVDAAPDGAGGTFLAGYLSGHYGVARLGPDGDLDRRFGWVRLPGAFSEEGLWIVNQGVGRAVVFDPSYSVCRQYCPSHPKMFRVLR